MRLLKNFQKGKTMPEKRVVKTEWKKYGVCAICKVRKPVDEMGIGRGHKAEWYEYVCHNCSKNS